MKSPDLVIKKKSWYKRWWAIILFIIFGLLIVFAPFYVYQTYSIYKQIKTGVYVSSSDFQGEAPYDMTLLIDQFSASFGNENAVVKVVEFGDFNCQMCKQAYPVVKKLKAEYGDKIQFYWRNFPVINDSSITFAKAGVCANEQELFWPLHDYMFEMTNTNLDRLTGFLIGLGLDKNIFEECLDNKLTSSQILKDYYAAADGEVRGTPTFFINGYKVQGVLPYELWQKILDKFILNYENQS